MSRTMGAALTKILIKSLSRDWMDFILFFNVEI